MGFLFEKISADYRYQEALKSCMNCGICTAICPAAKYYKYEPRNICNIVQQQNEEEIEKLLRSDTIWYCGQCMSCKTRCPRNNIPGSLISVLRKVSQEMGFFVDSEKGRQQYAIEQVVGNSILERGYCVHPDILPAEMHPEQGPVWEWFKENIDAICEKVGANYKKEGAGALRKIRPEVLEEIYKIFEITGGIQFREKIECFSEKKAKEMNVPLNESNQYLTKLLTENNNQHCK